MNELLKKVTDGMIIGGVALIGYSVYKNDKLIQKYQKMHDDDKQLISVLKHLVELKDIQIGCLEKELEKFKSEEEEA